MVVFGDFTENSLQSIWQITGQTTSANAQSPQSSKCTISDYTPTENANIKIKPVNSTKEDFTIINAECSQDISVPDKIKIIKPLFNSQGKRFTQGKRLISEIIGSSNYKSQLETNKEKVEPNPKNLKSFKSC